MAIKVSNTTVIDDDRNITSVGIATVGSGSSTITLDGISGNVNVGTGVTIEGIPGNISIAGTLSALGFNIPPNIVSYSPGIGETDVTGGPVTILLTFDQVIGLGTGGTVELKSGSPSGVGIATLSIANATRLSNYQVRILSSGTVLPSQIEIYPVVSSDYIISAGGFPGINTGSGPSYSFTTRNFTYQSITPSNGATSVSRTGTSITLSFNNTPLRGSGTIYLRKGSTTGSVVRSYNAASSGDITVSGNDWIISIPVTLTYESTFYLVIPANAIQGFAGLNVDGASSHSFSTAGLALGDTTEGGPLICKSGGVYWIASQPNTEVTRVLATNSGDAALLAQQTTGCTGWFVPSLAQWQNPAYVCRTRWQYTNTTYWTSTNEPGYGSRVAMFSMANGAFAGYAGFCNAYPLRVFRTVTY